MVGFYVKAKNCLSNPVAISLFILAPLPLFRLLRNFVFGNCRLNIRLNDLFKKLDEPLAIQVRRTTARTSLHQPLP